MANVNPADLLERICPYLRFAIMICFITNLLLLYMLAKFFRIDMYNVSSLSVVLVL